MIFVFFGIRLVTKNYELLDKDQTYVFIANHRSQLDIPAYALATHHTIRFLAKEELTKIPLMGFIIRRLYIPVNRKDKEARAKSMENMDESIREGISVFICPEGTRNKGGEPLLPFRDGAFRLAIESQVSIATLVILYTEKLLSPMRPIELSPGKIICQCHQNEYNNERYNRSQSHFSSVKPERFFCKYASAVGQPYDNSI